MTPSANTSVSGNALAALDAELERLDRQLADARRAAFAACAELADAWLRKGRLLAECGRTEEAARAFVTAAEHAGQARGGEVLPATLGNGQAPADRAALLRALDAA